MDDDRIELITQAALKRSFVFQITPPDRGDYILHPDSWVTPGDTEEDLIDFRAYMVANTQYRYDLDVGLNNGAWLEITTEDIDLMLTTYYPNVFTYYSQDGGDPLSIRGRMDYKKLIFTTLSAYFTDPPVADDLFISGSLNVYRITSTSLSSGVYTLGLAAESTLLTADDAQVYLFSDAYVPLYA